jgi:hypothetical protein
MTSVTVHQLTSKHSGSKLQAFMNVEEEIGFVSIWGACHEHPTYLLIHDEVVWKIIQFDNETFAEEWLSENRKLYSKIFKLESKEKQWLTSM